MKIRCFFIVLLFVGSLHSCNKNKTGTYHHLAEASKDPLSVIRLHIHEQTIYGETDFPDAFYEMKNLEELYIDSFCLRGPSSKILDLKRLKKVVIGESRASAKLISWFFQLDSIEYLAIHNTPFLRLPKTLDEASHLEYLDLSGCGVMITSDIYSPVNLRELNISGNGTPTVPYPKGKVSNIEILHAENCNFLWFPTAVFRLKNLKELYISGASFELSEEEKRVIEQDSLPNCKIYW